MPVSDCLPKDITREKVARKLCDIANGNVLHMMELGLFHELGPQFGLGIEDFVDDQSVFTEYEKNYIGLYNWRFKEDM